MNFRFLKIRTSREKIKSLALIVFGTLTLALGCAAFLIPFELVCGGITGLAIVISELIKGGVEGIEIGITALSWIAFFIGLFFLGKSFALKTLLSTALYPVFISVFLHLGADGAFSFLLHYLWGLPLAATVGGALVGIGCALSFIGGGSTGGVDILALVIEKKASRMKLSKILLFIDSAIILMGALVISDAALSLFGILSALTSALAVELVFWAHGRIKNI